jgi:hypothetical protein
MDLRQAIITGRPALSAKPTTWFRRVMLSANESEHTSTRADQPIGAVDLYWIPLGAGANVVRISGKLFEATSAVIHRRQRRDLYHSALEVFVPEGRFAIEQAPIRDGNGAQRGVVAEGPVGARWAGRFRLFRYEIRRWRGGRIPDIDDAVASPVRLVDDLTVARRIVEVLPSIPTPVWGRDQLHLGEMWNSNSVIAWVLACSGVNLAEIRPPNGGRAPGWNAGLTAAARPQPSTPQACPRGDHRLLRSQRRIGRAGHIGSSSS